MEPGDTCLGIKVKAQDQTGMPVSTIKVARFPENQWNIHCSRRGWSTIRVQKFKQLIEISDDEVPFNRKEPPSIVTEEDLKADVARVEAEREAGLEGLRNQGYRIE